MAGLSQGPTGNRWHVKGKSYKHFVQLNSVWMGYREASARVKSSELVTVGHS